MPQFFSLLYRLVSPRLALLFIGMLCTQVGFGAEVDFESEIKPILESACVNCHNENEAEGGLRLDSRELAIEGGGEGAALVPGKPNASPLLTLMKLTSEDDLLMPPVDGGGGKLSASQIARVEAWIKQGAAWPKDAVLKSQPRIDFVKHIQPILEENCLSCHSDDKAEGDLSLATAEAATRGGASGPTLVAFDPEESPLYATTILESDSDEIMPPSRAGQPLRRSVTDKLRMWIEQGAVWPANLRLKKKPKRVGNDPTTDDLELITKIHQKVVEQSKAESTTKSKAESTPPANYQEEIPSTKVTFDMVALKAGAFKMGSPDSEANRSETEGPQNSVNVAAFWIGKCEVTWDEYEPFMVTNVPRYKNGSRIDFDSNEHSIVDAVSQPTPPYKEMSFGMGQKGFPAISMTQHAANKYCQWLSAQTGRFYRLPTEAEWEYACRAGSTTAYSFGDDAARIGDYAWYYENSNEKYQKVGTKKPNAWGIHDMHGNVMEWTADAYATNYFALMKDKPNNPLLRPKKLYPRTVRGGNWDDDAEQLRSAARRGSDSAWKVQDPQLPKSVWYHTNATGLGFRVVRPVEIPNVDEMSFYWNSASGLTR